MKNINTKEYWESRFKTNNWSNGGQKQTKEYAKANIKYMNIGPEMNGTILDFGCALGDAIPVYKKAFPSAKLLGFDISEEAVKICNQKHGRYAHFISGDDINLPTVDVIIASHVMEHLTDDRSIANNLLDKCNDLFVFVPYKENPLYIEHVNYYENDYYDNFNVSQKKIFTVTYKKKHDVLTIIKNLIRFKYSFFYTFSKDIIMFHIKKSDKHYSKPNG